MKPSLFTSAAPIAAVISLLAAVTGGPVVLAEDLGSSTSLVDALVDSADRDSWMHGKVESAPLRKAGGKASLRLALPARDRVETLGSSEVFRNSRIAMPLLVADLEPKVKPVARPMSGQSVGAPAVMAWPQHSVDRVPSFSVPPPVASRR